MTVHQWYKLIGEKGSIFDVPDPEIFKQATANILCNILHLDATQKREELKDFCHLIDQTIDINGADIKEIHSKIAAQTKIIKNQLENDEYKMLQFMKMLNRFIMIDECKEEDYCIFEEVRKLLFDT